MFRSSHRTYRGIKNSGNWCYLNSILQSLASSSGFVQHLKLLATVSSTFSSTLLDCLLDLRHQTSSSSLPYDPTPIIELIAASNPSFCNRNEQDAHELFEVILRMVAADSVAAVQRSQRGDNHGLKVYAAGLVHAEPAGSIVGAKLFACAPFNGMLARSEAAAEPWC